MNWRLFKHTMGDLSTIMQGLLATYSYEEILAAMPFPCANILARFPVEILAKIAACTRTVGVFIGVNKHLTEMSKCDEFASQIATIFRKPGYTLAAMHCRLRGPAFDIRFYLRYGYADDLRKALQYAPHMRKQWIRLQDAASASTYDVFECILDNVESSLTGLVLNNPKTIEFAREYARKPSKNRHQLLRWFSKNGQIFTQEGFCELLHVSELDYADSVRYLRLYPSVAREILKKYPNLINDVTLTGNPEDYAMICHQHPYDRVYFESWLSCRHKPGTLQYIMYCNLYDLGHPATAQ